MTIKTPSNTSWPVWYAQPLAEASNSTILPKHRMTHSFYLPRWHSIVYLHEVVLQYYNRGILFALEADRGYCH